MDYTDQIGLEKFSNETSSLMGKSGGRRSIERKTHLQKHSSSGHPVRERMFTGWCDTLMVETLWRKIKGLGLFGLGTEGGGGGGRGEKTSSREGGRCFSRVIGEVWRIGKGLKKEGTIS